MLKYFLITYGIGWVVLFGVACKTYKPVEMPAVKQMPDSFTTKPKDSTNTGDFSWKVFFNDQYLSSLIDSALLNNQDLLIASQRIEIARAYYMKTKGATNPTLSAQLSAGVEKYGDYTMNGVGNFDTNLSPNISPDQKIPNPTPDYFLGLRSSWEVDLWGKLKNRKKAAAAKILASQSGQRLIVTSLVSDIANAYYSLLFFDNELKIIKKNIQYQAQALDIVKLQKEAGRATELAVQQFQAQLYHTQSFEHKIKQDIIGAEVKINFLMGKYYQPIKRDTSISNDFLVMKVKSGIPSQLIERRPDIQEAEKILEAASADVNAARAAYLPSFTINPYLGMNAFSAALWFNPASVTYGIFAGLTGPLLNKNEIKTDYSIAVAENKQAVFNYQKIILHAFNEVFENVNQIDNYKKINNLKEQEVQQLSMAVSSANELYVTGYASYLEVITAQKAVLEAELELNDSQRNIAFALIQIYKSLGGGWK